MSRFRIRTASSQYQRAALLLLVERCTGAADEASCGVLREQLQRGQGGGDDLLVALQEDQVLGSILSLPQPGKLAFLWQPAVRSDQSPASAREIRTALMEAALERLDRSDIAIVQCLLDAPDDPFELELIEHDFVHRTDLQILRCVLDPEDAQGPAVDGAAHMPSDSGDPAGGSTTGRLEWERYSSRRHELFAEVVEASWIDTRDCPYLVGSRSGEDLLAICHVTLEECRRNWWLLRRDGEAAGVLMAQDEFEQCQLDLVYMGVVPAARGHGLGRSLVQQTLRLARERKYRSVQVAVDTANSFAQVIYEQAGFRPVEQSTVRVRLRGQQKSPRE